MVIRGRTYRTAHPAALSYAGTIALRLYYSSNTTFRTYTELVDTSYRRMRPIFNRFFS